MACRCRQLVNGTAVLPFGCARRADKSSQPVYPLRMVSNGYKQFMAEAGAEMGSRKGEKRPSDPAMDLKNMRENGVRSLRVHCLHCGVARSVNVDGQPEHLTVIKLRAPHGLRQLRGAGADMRPNWQEKALTIPKP